ncbi:MAG: LysM peptidoglycan-binding domain-containing protein [Anaerolineales bacterium]|nr:LysM peptidoglycan-binding domain-containing protein [Anaerolineales bacterium]
MKKSGRLLLGILIAALSFIAVVVGLSLTLINWEPNNQPVTTNPGIQATGLPTFTQPPSGPTNTPPAILPTATSGLATYTPPPPQGWERYPVAPKDNLYSISLAHNIAVADLQAANCLKDSTFIQAGQTIYVPKR